MSADMALAGLRRLRPVDWIAAVLAPMPKSSFAKVATLETSLYLRNQLLRDTDWASMAHSLEIRVPLVDVRLLNRLAPTVTRLPVRQLKRTLAGSPRVSLPNAVVERAKTGFRTPVETWLQRDDRLHQWKRVSSFADSSGHWSRRWAYQVGAA
jgi:asparagine synthase (glutamine-hydrolysing)